MTWRTSRGVRSLKGAEAVLVREALGSAAGRIGQEIDGVVEAGYWEFYVSQFDQLEPLVKFSLLAQVGWALLRDTETVPPLTAINEATVAALFNCIQQEIEMEIDVEVVYLRPLVLAVFQEMEDTDDMEFPSSDCDDVYQWNRDVDLLSDQILWDRDFELIDDVADLPPEQASAIRAFARINGDYFTAIPPSPRDAELARIRAVIKELCES